MKKYEKDLYQIFTYEIPSKPRFINHLEWPSEISFRDKE